MIEALPFPALLIGAGEIVLAANAGAEALFGREIRGRPYGMYLRQPQILAAMAQVTRGEQPEPVPDAPYLVHVRGSTDGILILWQDQSEADALGQMRRDFVANVSHELRTPLTSLMGFIETLNGPAGQDSAARTRFLGIMERESRRMNRLIADLLSLSSVEANERVRPRNALDLSELVKSVVTRLAPLVETASIKTELTEAVSVPGDLDQLGQALSNLVENALRYGKPGGTVTISLDVVDDPLLMARAAKLSVRDEGEGIAAHHIPRLTERFYRVDHHRSRELGGTGLGLAIVKHIANRHRGRLKIESQPGKGSVFTLLLPLS